MILEKGCYRKQNADEKKATDKAVVPAGQRRLPLPRENTRKRRVQHSACLPEEKKVCGLRRRGDETPTGPHARAGTRAVPTGDWILR
ncbi:unnamed protein product [Sphagnum troendelagicum]|uniref:Uncharacterized protein n=1 Tax=Sphagnum troendelagicum TaxID=128251 RepID=A0ABP0UC45_9BRYO